MKGSFKVLFRLAAKIFFTVIFTVFLLECGVRLVLNFSLNNYLTRTLPQPYGSIMRRVGGLTFHGIGDLSKFDPVCFFIPKGGFFRSPEGRMDCPREKEAGEIRVICIGDSTTYGLGSDYSKNWVYLLGKTLTEHYPGKKIRVLNAGISGAHSRQIKRFFQFHLKFYRPDILIWRGGDALTDTYFVNTKMSFIRHFIWRCLYESRIFRVVCVFLDRNEKYQYPKTTIRVYDFLTQRTPQRPVLSQEFDSDFSMVKKIAQEHGTRYALRVEYLRCEGRDAIVSLDQYKGSEPYVPMLEAFKEYRRKNPSEDLFIDIDNVHLTEAGEALTAEEISRFMINHKWIESFN